MAVKETMKERAMRSLKQYLKNLKVTTDNPEKTFIFSAGYDIGKWDEANVQLPCKITVKASNEAEAIAALKQAYPTVLVDVELITKFKT